MVCVAGGNTSADRRVHLPAGAGEDQTVVAELSTEAVDQPARGRGHLRRQEAQD